MKCENDSKTIALRGVLGEREFRGGVQTLEISGSCSAPWQKQRAQNKIENRTPEKTKESIQWSKCKSCSSVTLDACRLHRKSKRRIINC